MMMLKATGAGQPTSADTPASWREAPHNLEAEQALLGAVLIHNGVVDRLDGVVEPEDFFDPLHGDIYRVAVATVRAGRPANPVTLKSAFDGTEQIVGTMTVAQYLGRLAISATTIINAVDYGRTVHDLALRRRLITVGTDVVNAAYDDATTPPLQMVDLAERELAALAERHGGADEAAPLSVAMRESLSRVEAGFKNGGIPPGLPSGLIDLDRIVGGFEPGNLYVGAGRPGMGKTAWVIGIAMHLAKRGVPVDFYSLEMTRDQIANRVLAHEASLSGDSLRRGDITDAQYRALMSAAERLEKHPLIIDHRGGITIGQLQSRARRNRRRHGTSMVIVDYLQLLAGSGDRRGDNRVNELTEITTGLKALAKELHVPVLALSQLNRSVETRENKRPQLSDLRESGSIEQDADAVVMIFREEYYVAKAEPPSADLAKHIEWEAAMTRCRGKAELIVPKNRFGPTGLVEVAFDGPTTSFANLAREDGHGG